MHHAPVPVLESTVAGKLEAAKSTVVPLPSASLASMPVRLRSSCPRHVTGGTGKTAEFVLGVAKAGAFCQSPAPRKRSRTGDSGNTSCSSTCAGVDSCGQIGSCKIRACSSALRIACLNACPAAFINPLCKPACNKIADVCHDNNDNDCINRVQQCTQGVATCAGSWASGLRATCEAALAAIDATGFKGLAKVSGDAAGVRGKLRICAREKTKREPSAGATGVLAFASLLS
jgi:hypothetical protein